MSKEEEESSIIDVESEKSLMACREECEFLRRRLLEVEETLTRAENYFQETLGDMFESFPARASVSERGSVSLSLSNFFREDGPLPVDVSFCTRFENKPKVLCWIVIKRKSPPKPALFEGEDFSAQFLRPKDPYIVRLENSCITASERYASFTFDKDTVSVVRSLNEMYQETLESDFLSCAVGRSQISRQQSVPIATKIVLRWIAWNPPKINREIASVIESVFVSPPSLTKTLEAQLKKCLGSGSGPAPLIDEGDNLNQTLLHAAATVGNIELGEYLLKRGANINAQDSQGWTPLLLSISFQHVKMTQWLLQNKANPFITCEHGYTALHLLCRWESFNQSQTNLMDTLLLSGLDINVRSDAEETPLLYLCRKQIHCVPLVCELLKRGADPTIPDENGVLPIHVAIQNSNIPLAEVLVSGGAVANFQPPDRVLIPVSVPISLNNQEQTMQQMFLTHNKQSSLPVRKQSIHQRGYHSESNPAILAMKMHNPAMVRVVTGMNKPSLSNNTWIYILSMLEPRDLAVAARVSRKWQQMAFALFQTPLYWNHRCGMSREQYLQYTNLCRQIRSKNSASAPKTKREYSVDLVRSDSDIPKANVPKLTVLVLGHPGCGKTSFIHRFCARSFEEGSASLPPVSGTEAPTERALVKVKDGGIFDFVFVDAPGKSPEKGMEKQWKEADCAVIMCDLNMHLQDPVEGVEELLCEWKINCTQNNVKNVAIVASKIDERPSSYFNNAVNVMHFALSSGTSFFTSSAKNGVGVDEIVQSLFMRKHQIQHSRASSLRHESPSIGKPSSPIPFKATNSPRSGEKSTETSPNNSSPMRMPVSQKVQPPMVNSPPNTSSSPKSPPQGQSSPGRSPDECHVM